MALTDITARIRAAESAAGRAPGSVTLIAVSTVQPEERIRAVLDAGHRTFGENRVEVVQGVDSLAIATELDKQAAKLGRRLGILLEVNVAGESSKFGWRPDDAVASIPALNALPRLDLLGLMTVAPYATDPEKVRPVFRRLRELRERCEAALGAPLPVLSMGMSGDLEVAIEEGSTLVRVGTALFGARPSVVRKQGESE